MSRGKQVEIIATQDKLALINEENKQLLKEFVEYLDSTDRSSGTIKGYVSDIQICFVWMLENTKNKSFIEFNKRDMMRYQNYLINVLQCSPNRTRRLRASLSSLSNFIENVLDDDYKDFRNIINKIPAPIKNTVRDKTVLTDEQVQELLDHLVDTEQYQKACILALAWASGSRKSELLRFKVSYFDNSNIKFGSLYKTPEKMKTKGRGKLGKQLNRYVIVSKFKPYLELWMNERNQLNITNEELFVSTYSSNFGNALNVNSLDTMTSQFTNFLGVDFYFHCLRHNFTTQLSKTGVPAQVIQELIGWSDIGMVSLYDDTEVDDKLGEFFTEDGIVGRKKVDLSDL